MIRVTASATQLHPVAILRIEGYDYVFTPDVPGGRGMDINHRDRVVMLHPDGPMLHIPAAIAQCRQHDRRWT